MKHISVVALLSLLVSACGFSENRKHAEDAAGQLHAQFNAAQFAEIYQSASGPFRATGSQADFVAYLEAVRRKLGAFKSADTTFVNVNSTTVGTFVTLNLKSQFDQDSAAEEFTFLIADGRTLLQHYNINSKTLVMK